MYKTGFIVAMMLLLTGCATSKNITYSVSSDPVGAQIDVNGVNMGSTPLDISLMCAKRWVGLAVAPGGWANTSGKYEVKAYPPKGFSGQSQVKMVNPCEWAGEGKPALSFDLSLEKVFPTQKIELIGNSSSNKYQQAVQSLRTLRDQGVITEEEYKQKILKLNE